MVSIIRERATEGETVHSVVIFSRHGDRTAKTLGTTKLTALGKNQVYSSGQFYRARYLNSNSSHFIKGITGDRYVEKEVFASAPDQQPLLVQSSQVFLQGLYPPQNVTEILADGTTVSSPANGQQFPILHSVSSNSPDSIWLKGDDNCPRHDQTLAQFFSSQQFKDLTVSTKSFYQSFADLLQGVIPTNKADYSNAYAIFDYLNVGNIHNSTIAQRVSSEDLAKLRYLADSHEWALNGNITTTTPNPISVSGSTLARAILAQLNSSVITPNDFVKLSVLFGSYDTFLSFFALTSLPSVSPSFYGLPDYASTIAFELVSYPSSDTDMYVRFLFRNGTSPESPLTEYPLFGQGRQNALMPYNEFYRSMDRIAIDNVDHWCDVCDSLEDVCQDRYVVTDVPQIGHPRMKAEVAGCVGALCALAAVAIIAAALMLLDFRFTKKEKKAGKAKSLVSVDEGIDVKA
ncbi:phosphoglycerate mutase-like protein [Choiromyces venosus 120613-1]|uniref:Phosphoglycerate mutase-like protein n=1 Tax=Choiromyces venosus 120613-1 TaxID=1336337 RepID=A0A3N4K6P9_9PEZI|nr:phosphoglycerate mutase-like protein [Choiromyces venosus 120613-1]